MRLFHEQMSFEEFERLPRRPGWRYEYYGGGAHVTPRGGVTLSLDLRHYDERRPSTVPDGVRIRPVDAGADRPSLEEVFVAAFEGGPEYAGAPPAALALEAIEYFSGFFGPVRGTPSIWSRVVEARGHVVGAALAKEEPGGSLLDCIMVRPDCARRGLASAAAADVVRALVADGERRLASFVMLANEASLAWHLHFGFRERPDPIVATHRWRAYAQEAERGRRFGLLDQREIQRFDDLAQYWRSEAQRMDSREKRAPPECPSDTEPDADV